MRILHSNAMANHADELGIMVRQGKPYHQKYIQLKIIRLDGGE